MTALHRAASYSHEEIVRLLINAGADVNVQNFFTGGALHFAAYRQNVNIIRMLLAHGADVNAIGGWAGCSALQIATSEGWHEVARLLISAGADVHYINSRSREDIANRLPLELAVERGYEDIVKLFLEPGADITRQMKTAALAKAREHHRGTIAALLSAAGTDPVEAEKPEMEQRRRSLNSSGARTSCID